MNYEISLNPFAGSGKFRGRNLHLGVTGSIACYKTLDLLRAWVKIGVHVSATLSPGAREFLSPLLFRALGAFPVYGEMFENRDEVFSHLEPGQMGGVFMIVPASADFIAKAAAGMADELLCCQALAFAGPKFLAPAMNPAMLANPLTEANIQKLLKAGWRQIKPEKGLVACGDIGEGRLAPTPEIFLAALKGLSPQDMTGLNILATLGPTREYWDGVRFWSNPSSGKMGASLATAAWLRGANVTAVCGPGINVYLPADIKAIQVETAQEMFDVASDIWPNMQMGFFCAAVADYKPLDAPGKAAKFKKTSAGEEFSMRFRANPDILRSLAAQKIGDQKVLGFAAEMAADTQTLAQFAREKLRGKNSDIIAANSVNAQNGAFGADANSLVCVDKNGREEIWPPRCKADIAWDLCSWLLQI